MVKDLKFAFNSLKEGESKLRGIDYSSEIKNLKNRLNNLPNYKFLTNYYVDEFLADASMGLQGAKEVYLITNYYGYAFLYTNKTSFKTKGAFSMYVKVVPANGAKSTLPEQAQKAYKSANISSLFVEISDEEYRRNEEEKKSLINQIDELEQGVSTFNNLKHGIENKIDEIKSDLSKNFLYDIAVAEFNNKNYEEASKIFSKLKGFKDSDKKLLECGSVSIYETAVGLMNEGKYQEALSKFKTVSFYKDSINIIKECERNNTYEMAINLFNNKSYLEAKEQFENIKEFKDSSNKLLECQNYINQSEYETALNLLNNKNYAEALKKFKTINSYKDSSSKISECQKHINESAYETALSLLKNKNYQEALDKFKSISDYKDSSSKILECESLMKQSIYDLALNLIKNKNYQEAIKKFNTIVDYKDSAKKILECENSIKQSVYDSAVAFMSVKKYQEAINKFKSIDGFKDSANKIHECENGLLQLAYESANDLLNKNKFEEAIKAFESIINYKDSKQKIKECEKRQLEHFVKTFDIKMVLCPAGSFMMGDPKGINYDRQHKVFLSKSFAIGKYEITQIQYKTIMGENPSKFEGDSNPVENVSWKDAKEFCNKLNAIYADKLPKGYKFNLPTEAQWEYACRAGTTTKYCNGDSDDKLGEVAWYSYNSGYKTHPVGQKKPNAWGIHDMHGNILELCRDRYEKNYPSDDVIDPVLPYNSAINDTFYIVKRGGDCDCESVRVCRSAYRERDAYKLKYLGFRLALVPIQ